MLARAHKPAFSWNRSAAFAAVIGLHVAGFYLVSAYGGFGRIVEVAAGALKVVQLNEVVRPEPEPAIERPRLEQASRFQPTAPVPLSFDDEAPASGAAIAVGVDEGGHGTGERGGESVRLPTIPATPLTYRSRRSTDEYYPAVSIRLAEEGAAIVRVCVDANGALQGLPQVTESSGHARLDTAAVAWTREALVFTPATENGARIASCKGFRVRFTLRQ